MTRVGIIGMGMMGRTHFEAYSGLENAEVVAIADIDPKRAQGDLAGTGGNVLEGGVAQVDMGAIKGTTDYRELVAMPDVDLVDVCVPTPVHMECALAALEAGKHVLCEKPLARTLEQGRKIVDAAAEAKGFFMPAMCIRFWPEWAYVKEAVADGRYGKVKAAVFRRVATMPGNWYPDGEQSGGAIMDLHVHDTDFVNYLFGKPRAVSTRGYTKTSGKIDHLVTSYIFDEVPLVVAEGAWCMADGFGFTMRYTVNFERATVDCDSSRKDALVVCADGRKETVDLGGRHGYDVEIEHFVGCIEKGERPTTVTVEDALTSLEIVEAERRSAETGEVVSL